MQGFYYQRIEKIMSAVFEVRIGSGNRGVIDTLKVMRRMVREYRRNPQIIALVQSLLANVNEKWWVEELSALLRFVQRDVRYTLDVNEVEVLQSPTHLLQTRQGDCDDKSTLLATMIEAAGHKARFEAVGFDGENLSHVLVSAQVGNDWLPLETTEPVNAGWYPPNVNTKYVLNI